MVKVLFVCLGNICRSPSAHGIFEAKVKAAGLDSWIEVDSAGTAAYHVGNPPDPRSMQHASKRGYDLSHLRARQAITADFEYYDYILAMDAENLRNLQAIAPDQYAGELALFLKFTDMPDAEVPDPYYGGEAGFEHVLDLVESASEGLIAHIKRVNG